MFDIQLHASRCKTVAEKIFLEAIARIFSRIEKLGFSLETKLEFPPYTLDFAFCAPDGRKLCVEIDEDLHEYTEEKQTAEYQKDSDLGLSGWVCLHFVETEIYKAVSTRADETLLHLRQMSAEHLTESEIEELATEIASTFVRLTASERGETPKDKPKS